jgi:hypothetical protein
MVTMKSMSQGLLSLSCTRESLTLTHYQLIMVRSLLSKIRSNKNKLMRSRREFLLTSIESLKLPRSLFLLLRILGIPSIEAAPP